MFPASSLLYKVSYWCLVNTDNSLLEGLLYLYKPIVDIHLKGNANFFV